MREIKFRGWDNTEKKMNQIDMIDFSDGTASSRECNGWFDIEEEISLMQYTGLKDKNGIEIYEGDIVKADWGYGKGKYVVDFEEIICAKYNCTISEDIEVIGNIYENPELLENN